MIKELQLQIRAMIIKLEKELGVNPAWPITSRLLAAMQELGKVERWERGAIR